uniref:Oligoribonuclease, mitochondrial n=2 Tax=Lepeophtheirus salmonis TaxID=72036 RepID=D3PFS2_LEPSM|nr:Oligoribonuclease, mitochondrial [Lepeophtheirus salmonis]
MFHLGRKLATSLFLPSSPAFHAYSRNLSMSENRSNRDRIVWIDCEMTGLDLEVDVLMEVAVIITDKNLKPTKEGLNIVIHQPDSVLDAMTGFPKESHAKTGLTAACRMSKIDVKQAENDICNFIKRECGTTFGRPLLAGNSVGFDAKFLRKYMPSVTDILHYRIIDVSTIHECYNLWDREKLKFCPKKRKTHRALDDILESIEQMKVFKRIMFKQN